VALAKKRCDSRPKASADSHRARGKPAKVVAAAVMRKRVDDAKLVLQGQQP
jgi:hypothetical protein